MRLVFAATAGFAVPSLRALLATSHDIAAVYTQPDRPAGRGRKARFSPVKSAAVAASLPVVQPTSLRTSDSLVQLRAFAPDVIVVVAYGQILSQTVLDIPRLGCLNVHASLLPRWRGAAPIQRAVMAGDRESGVCIMKMDAGLDTGGVLARQRCEILPGATAGDLHDQLAEIGAALLVRTLTAYEAGELTSQPQSTAGVTYADKLLKEEARLDWSRPAGELQQLVLGLNPWPVAQTDFADRTLRIWRAHAVPAARDAVPGTVIAETPEGIDVACGDGALRITELQLPGRRPIAARDFLNAHSLRGVVFVSRPMNDGEPVTVS